MIEFCMSKPRETPPIPAVEDCSFMPISRHYICDDMLSMMVDATRYSRLLDLPLTPHTAFLSEAVLVLTGTNCPLPMTALPNE
jgi:hypothetical protein